MPSLYQIFLLLIILFITPSLAVDFQGLPDKVKVMIFRHLKLPLDSGSPPRLTPLVPCLLVCRYWHHFLNSNVLWEDVSIEVNAKFHQFIRIPKLRIPVTKFMGAFSLVLRTEFDMRKLTMPKWVQIRRRQLDPAYSHNSSLNEWMGVLSAWRLTVGQAFKQDLVNLQKLFIYPEAFPVLHYFSCTLDRAPPYDLDPQPASFSIDDDDILALTSRLIKYKGFVLTREEHDAERCFVSAARVKWEDARDDDAMEE